MCGCVEKIRNSLVRSHDRGHADCLTPNVEYPFSRPRTISLDASGRGSLGRLVLVDVHAAVTAVAGRH